MFYKLNEKNELESCSFDEWTNLFKNENSRIIFKDCFCGYVVLTIFTGIDYLSNEKVRFPLVFQTMIFDKEGNNLRCNNSSSYDWAKGFHKESLEVAAWWSVSEIKTI